LCKIEQLKAKKKEKTGILQNMSVSGSGNVTLFLGLRSSKGCNFRPRKSLKSLRDPISSNCNMPGIMASDAIENNIIIT
jgi:hypothetical protein